MTKILAMFPGQGSQFVGMGRDVLEQFPASQSVFQEAEEATKINIRRLCLEGPEEELKLTANTQPCILTVSVAIWKVLQQETSLQPALFAGHSLGEYSAVVAAGKLDLSRAAYLVRRRGEAMQQAVPEGVGAMAAVMNCPVEDLEARCAKASRPQQMVQVVNYNSEQQLVVAGHKAAVDELCTQLEADKIRFVPLAVSAPFHSSLMSPARESMTPLLMESTFHRTPNKVVANLTGEVVEDYTADYLIKQIDSPVRWLQSMRVAGDHGIETALEIGPGKVLFGLARRTLPKGVKLLATENVRETIQALHNPV